MEQFFKKLEHESLREFYFIAISLILAFGVLQTTGTVMNTEKPVVSVVSCSMYPQLHVGDVLFVQGKGFDQIKEQDVVVYSVKEASVDIEGHRYNLTRYNGVNTVETSAGDIGLVNVFSDNRGNAVEAIIQVNGQNVRVREGTAYQVNGKKLAVKDIRGMSIPVVHRVIKKTDTYVETKGDNNRAQLDFESRVGPEQIHGKVLFLIPRVGGLKLLVMDLLGYNGAGDRPLSIDTYPQCTERTS